MSDSPVQTPYTEPWLRGTHADVPAAGRAVLHALDLSLDDLTKWTAGLTDVEVHSQPLGLTSIAFHLRHIARSVDRILTYAEGGQLSQGQLAALKTEQTGAEQSGAEQTGSRQAGSEQGREGKLESLAELLAEVEVSFNDAADRIRVLATADLNTPRFVGRKQLPTSIGGAMIHVADHTQRHTGQVVTTAKVIKALRT
jgi:uncharacterized damage-inducible protein DinB